MTLIIFIIIIIIIIIIITIFCFLKKVQVIQKKSVFRQIQKVNEKYIWFS